MHVHGFVEREGSVWICACLVCILNESMLMSNGSSGMCFPKSVPVIDELSQK
jgi:hypothetical protein